MKEKMLGKNSMFSLLFTIIPACIGAAVFRWDAGVWMILPIYPICVATASIAARFFPVKLWLRALFFPVLTSLLNMFVGENLERTAAISVIALLCFAAVECAVSLFFRKRALPAVCGVLLTVCYLAGSTLFLGNPVSAVKTDRLLRDYIETHYDTESGHHSFSAIRYDYGSGFYTVKAANGRFPTEVCTIFAVGDFVVDHYRDLLEDQETRDEALSITEELRASFGTDMFSVVQMGIDGFDRTLNRYDVYNENDYAPDMNFCIRLSGKPTVEKLYDAAWNYHTVLEASDIKYGEILYAGGEGLRFRIALILPSEDNIFERKVRTTVYVLRHHENHSHLQNNGLLSFIDRKLTGSILLYG